MGVKLSKIMEKLELNEIQTRQFFYGQGISIDMFTVDSDEEISREDIEALVKKFGGHPISMLLSELLRSDHSRYKFLDSKKFDKLKKIATQNPDD
ncbi:MAG: hypothetical protein ACTSQ8_23400 [Candidatus Helarchaeota archaeon]